ncbi:hypothetical protein [Luteolibacter soli]|uniref:Transcriptional regulator n=1 Tax=Luteolibacter soli TaxID=3135280 RepID=A0ABU9B1T2_9BACT
MREAIHEADSLDLENEIFETALQLTDPERRREYLDRTFYGDRQGREGMEELLGMTGIASSYFLEGRQRMLELAREVLEELPEWVGVPVLPPKR